MSATVAPLPNPFPGLRPFREDEVHLFFGRESKVDLMVDKLAVHRFLAVVGTSGSGKSSLVNCGLRPALQRGLMSSAGPLWRMAQFRPGFDPIRNLAGALAADGVLFPGYDEELPLAELIETFLRQSTQGLVSAVRQARLPAGVNLLVVADQFEELFRFRRLGLDGSALDEGASEQAIAFVNLLLAAQAQRELPIYVVMTMRSDFLGECAHFHGLPEAMNAGQYLVPRLTREERRASIAGPVAVGGAEIDPVLLNRLVNDVGDNPDQLSILQHALHRTWAWWQQRGATGPLALAHYESIGSMREALNQHAEEAFAALGTPRREKLCEIVFKALTDLGTDPRGIRRPLKLGTLCDLADGAAELEEIKSTIDVFREPSRAFLMPPATETLTPDSVIDISHESLMRVWTRLRIWAEDEAGSARRYRRLAETAQLEAAGQTGLWTDPELQLALDWRKERNPNAAWASLYGGNFEAAIAFLEKSRLARDTAEAEKIFHRKRKQVLLRAALLSVLAVLAAWGWKWWIDWSRVGDLAPSGGLYFVRRMALPVKLFRQDDPQWAQDEIGLPAVATVGRVGCALSSAAMVLESYGVDTDPGRLNSFLNFNEGYTSEGSIYWDKAATLAPDLVKPEVYENNPGSYQLIDQNLLRGSPVIVKLKIQARDPKKPPITHFVVIAGKDGFDYLTRDPLKGGEELYPLKLRESRIYGLRIYQKKGSQ